MVIEGGRAKLEDIKRRKDEEESIYADEFCGKHNVLISEVHICLHTSVV